MEGLSDKWERKTIFEIFWWELIPHQYFDTSASIFVAYGVQPAYQDYYVLEYSTGKM